ncbi:CehA/McbA family metallohydrolase [Asanoa iriomotensis]|uniref:Phosphoesterase n=1 Tax=Asanoa iriomotensis TaxID=234613 RepID=A0ABQ4C418_9ACTN|nr:CehA/McbA family metallohydrolase [Asanoa iriomotensis]GIF57543.1 phosphoesterase [Asanoa iriomotensis]
MATVNRRQLLLTAVSAGAASVVLDPVSFASATGPGPQTRTLSGTIAYGAPDWVYIPVDVPSGVNRISVTYSYDRPAPPPGYEGNALDIGVFDGDGFRGWSGGFRDSFTVSASDATPGYLPGRVKRGRWHLILGPYRVVPQGLRWTATVTLEFGPDGPAFTPRPAPHKAAGRGRAWYRGDMHLHTVHSDGRRTPAEVAAGARAAKLDFIVSTEHNTSSASGVWGAYAGPDLLIIDGEEITTRNGHYTALGLPAGTWIDWRYRAADGSLDRFVRDIHQADALAVAAHPLAPCVGCGWKFGYEGLDAVEVWNGPWTLDDEAVLANWDNLLVEGKRWIPAVGNSDAHSEPQVIGLPQTVVHADGLDRKSILAGVRAGRSWIAESAAVEVSFIASTVRGRTAGIGERLDVDDDTPVTVDLTVSGTPGCVARIVTDQGQRLLAPLPADGQGTVSWTTTPRNSRYVRAEIRRPQPTATTADTMVALTNPIFLGNA